MHQSKANSSYDSNTSETEVSEPCCMSVRKPSIIKSAQSFKKPKHSEIKDISEEPQSNVSPSSSQARILSRSSNQKVKGHFRGIQLNEAKVYSTPEFVMRDCWDSSKSNASTKLVELFKESNTEEDDLDVPIKKRRLELDLEDDKSPPYTREFHMLTEIQKSRILNAVEDTIKKLAVDDCYHGCAKEDRTGLPACEQANVERVICKKFLLPWVLLKVTELVICHVIQLTFLSDGSYFKRENEFLPIVVTYYLTLFVVIISLVVHISCFSYANVQNPCYFMGVISGSILTLTTTMGMLIMLSSMNYYRTYRQILVLVFISFLAFSLFAELYFFYVEVKTIWSRGQPIDQEYVT